MPIVANGQPDGARGARLPSTACRLAVIAFLEYLLQTGRILLDTAGEIQAEYRRHLNPRGQPGVGDRFYVEVIRAMADRVARIDLPKRDDGTFFDFPSDPALAGFDDRDRKFAALARRGRAPVANATDSDWLDHRAALAAHGITVDFICGCDRAGWFA